MSVRQTWVPHLTSCYRPVFAGVSLSLLPLDLFDFLIMLLVCLCWLPLPLRRVLACGFLRLVSRYSRLVL